jgi:chromosome segregation ATPase
MILFVFGLVAVAIALAAFEFAEEIADFKTKSISNLRSLCDELSLKNSALERELNKLTGDYNVIKKQLAEMQDKESEFITRIFEQHKETDLKHEENKSLIEANQNLQRRVIELEDHVDIMRKQHDRAVFEFKKVKAELAALGEAPKAENKRKKVAATAP